ncbi:Inner membrane protein YgaZ [Pseudodesulfovibrio hydrargyri]|uniref:Inner membrane protein YgaZ n=1 Tax=Pseudodesulfovibrio hydrargyri TaxID=2125990 RepID=A0A1J5NAX2_9BACT|nr:AzlC family ABC transporter permease [Pseudodesulfovibrio hydrargyri]OIQ50375.1 Inner membrane protein YgaZ [Pseudodesulfovibrio hydrargyri]
MKDIRQSFLSGARDSIPILLGMVPFGLICGAVSAGGGMSLWGALGFTWAINAGASQLAALQLMEHHASLAVVVLTGLVINLRFFMYSASIAPHLRTMSLPGRALLGFILSDQAYALSIARFHREDGAEIDKPFYYLGVGLAIWASYSVGAVLGASVGAFIPPAWDLGFAVPLTFIAVVVPAIKDRPTALAAVAAGTVAFLADGLPYNLGLMAGAVTGILLGYAAERRLSRD